MREGLDEIAVLVRRLSSERLAPYAVAAGGNLLDALNLYIWNAEISAQLAITIGHVEILLRNAIHESLTKWSTRRFAEPLWYRDVGRVLHAYALEEIRSAQRRAARGGTPEAAGRVVAELNLGFWRFLFANRYDQTLWREALHEVFPGRSRSLVRDAVEVVHLCRNRLAHHEPIFNRPIADIHLVALELAGWICPVTRNWIEQRCRLGEMLELRPS